MVKEKARWSEWSGTFNCPPYTLESIVLHKVVFFPPEEYPGIRFAIFGVGKNGKPFGMVKDITDIYLPNRRRLIEQFGYNGLDRKIRIEGHV